MPLVSGEEPIADCWTCRLRAGENFCDVSPITTHALLQIASAQHYPAGMVLFREREVPLGAYILCGGRVKLSAASPSGRKLIIKFAEPGEILGLTALMAGTDHEISAETVHPCRVKFIARDNLLRFLREHSEACFRAAEQLGHKCRNAARGFRLLGLSQTALERLARLLLQWAGSCPQSSTDRFAIKLPLHQEEIGEMIGTSRETVSRMFALLKSQGVAAKKRSTVEILNWESLERMAGELPGDAGEPPVSPDLQYGAAPLESAAPLHHDYGD